ncbi:MAG: hypothetical protein EHM28_14660, partial [Spirochaetaceae bacterium]
MNNASSVSITSWAAWAPGVRTREDWQAWARGELEIEATNEVPGLEFLPSLFKRRFSQLSKMVLQVGHSLVPEGGQIPCIFASHYGEVGRQYQISKGLLDAGEVSPSAFSLSVFNTPAFLLSIAEGNHSAGSALFAGRSGLAVAILEMLGFLKSRPGRECMVIFADEYMPAAYQSL